MKNYFFLHIPVKAVLQKPETLTTSRWSVQSSGICLFIKGLMTKSDGQSNQANGQGNRLFKTFLKNPVKSQYC
jgi:hypothetical protein